MKFTDERLTRFLSKLSQEDIRRIQVCSLREQFYRYDELADSADDLVQALIVSPRINLTNFNRPCDRAEHNYGRKNV